MSNIILIGFMGCGKTSVGKKLASRNKLLFVDTDALIENNSNQSIKDIFSHKGEAYFRELETATIKSLLDELDNAVISVGGGLPIKTGNGELLGQLGTVVFLDASLETINKRLKNDKDRPLFSNKDNKVEELYHFRKPIYTQYAHMIIQVDNMNIDDIIDDIEKQLIIKSRER